MVKTMTTPKVPDGTQETHEKFACGLELGAVGIDDANGLDLGGLLSGGSSGAPAGDEVSANVLDGVEGVLKRLFAGGVDGGDFLLDAEPVGGKAAGDVEELTGDDVSD